MSIAPEPTEATTGERYYALVWDGLLIYGHTVDAWWQEFYPEDGPGIESSRARGREWACWHSPQCPEGELGSNPMAALIEIDYEQYAKARELAWPQGDVLLVVSPMPN